MLSSVLKGLTLLATIVYFAHSVPLYNQAEASLSKRGGYLGWIASNNYSNVAYISFFLQKKN